MISKTLRYNTCRFAATGSSSGSGAGFHLEVLALLQLLLGDPGSPCVTTLVASLPLEALLAAQHDWTCCFVALETIWRPLGGRLEATWRPLGGHLQATWSERRAKLCSRRLQVGPKRLTVGLMKRQVGRKRRQVGSKKRQVGSKRRPRGSKLDQTGVQEGPKNCPKAVQQSLNSQEARTLNLHDPTTLWKVLERPAGQFGGPSGA